MIFTPHYDIRDFKWVKKENTFYGDGWDLYDAKAEHLKSFPKDGSQFVMINYKTGNFRRFRFQKQISDPFGNDLVFVSEDGFICQVNIDTPKSKHK